MKIKCKEYMCGSTCPDCKGTGLKVCVQKQKKPPGFLVREAERLVLRDILKWSLLLEEAREKFWREIKS